MAKTRLTRGKLLAAAAPHAAVPLVGRLALDAAAQTGQEGVSHGGHTGPPADHAISPAGHAAMVGEVVPAVGGPNDLDGLLYPPPALPTRPDASASTR